MTEEEREALANLRARFEGWPDWQIMLELDSRLRGAWADNNRLKRIAKEALNGLNQAAGNLDRHKADLERIHNW